ncbi:hypothetical protein FOE67_14480, partial [Streptomyces calidiresistens]|nr:hypothetical protein [Streptomyces calidiresistens]
MATGAGPGAGSRGADGARDLLRAVGSLVRDEETGRVGVLQDVLTFRDTSVPPYLPPRTRTLAYIRPEGGGREWTTDPGRVTVVGE